MGGLALAGLVSNVASVANMSSVPESSRRNSVRSLQDKPKIEKNCIELKVRSQVAEV